MQRPGQFKMVLLGESAVGKSSLALRFAKGQYQEHAESTIGAAFLTHTIQIDSDTALKVELWDTAGQERYHSLAPMYYRGAQAALVVYDLTNAETLRRAKNWVKELRQVNTSDMVIGLAGNKADLAAGGKRQVDPREVAEYVDENNLFHMETSAKRGDNVAEIFLEIARQVAAKQLSNTANKSNGAFPPTKPKSKDGKSCCSSGDSKP
mgnify:FL=1